MADIRVVDGTEFHRMKRGKGIVWGMNGKPSSYIYLDRDDIHWTAVCRSNLLGRRYPDFDDAARAVIRYNRQMTGGAK